MNNVQEDKYTMKKGMEEFIKSSYLPFVILALALILIHIKMKCNFSDDLVLKTQYKQTGLWDLLVGFYNNWGSPGLPLVANYLMIILPTTIFKICNIFVIVLAAWSISKITNRSDSQTINWVIVILMLLYPFMQMSTAGWIATSTTYMLPLALGLYSMVSIRRIISKEKVPYISSVAAILVGAGSLQMSCILAGIFTTFSIYFIKTKKPFKFTILQAIIAVSFIIYHMSAPGNANRYLVETATWFPDYNMISTINKIKLGFTNTLANFISTPNLFFTLFCLLILLGVLFKYKDNFYRIIASVPILSTLLFGLFRNVFSPIFPQLISLMSVNNYDFAQITTYNYNSKINYIPIIVGVVIIGCILLAIYLIFENTVMALLVNIIFLAGFASRMIMSFSPTLYASSTRTFIFMYFAILVCGAFIFKEIIKSINIKNQNQLLAGFGSIATLYYIELFLQI